jgi:hypothetical protein
MNLRDLSYESAGGMSDLPVQQQTTNDRFEAGK